MKICALSWGLPRLQSICFVVLALLSSPVKGDPLGNGQVPEFGPFGIGACALRGKDFGPWLPQIQELGVQCMRSPRVAFGAVEPTQGQFVWTSLDEQLAYGAANNIQFVGTLLGTPRWSTADKPNALPLHSLDAWADYVTHLTGHTKGKIKYYEVWNEPPNGTKNAPPEDYAKVVVSAYDAAKAGDPDCLVGIAAKSVDLNYIARAIQAGAKDHFDFITLHPYETLGSVVDHPGLEPVYMAIVPEIRKMLAEIDPAKVNVPVIFTEIGVDAKHEGPDVQGEALVKAYTMGIAQGIACINWFEGMDGDSGPMGLMEANGTKRPSFTALGQMIQYFGNRPKYLGWLQFNNKDYGFVFQGAKNPILVTWAPVGVTDKIDLGAASTIVDPLTGTTSSASTYDLTTAPIIVDNAPAALVTQAQANLSKPFPWDGDYTNATSVSVSFGATTETKGLHTLSGDSIAASVVAYGGNARAGSGVEGGNVYIVDPNFLRYTSTPIDITVVCRRDTTNAPASLALEYESTTGSKKLPAVAIPDNTDWFTQTWHIDDSQFVGMYAFNFRFNNGPYLVRSVTVTKR